MDEINTMDEEDTTTRYRVSNEADEIGWPDSIEAFGVKLKRTTWTVALWEGIDARLEARVSDVDVLVSFRCPGFISWGRGKTLDDAIKDAEGAAARVKP